MKGEMGGIKQDAKENHCVSESVVVSVLYAAFLSAVVAVISYVRFNHFDQFLEFDVIRKIVPFIALFFFASLYYLDEIICRSVLLPRQRLAESVTWILWVLQVAVYRNFEVAVFVGLISSGVLFAGTLKDGGVWSRENFVWLLCWGCFCLSCFMRLFFVIGAVLALGLVIKKIGCLLTCQYRCQRN